METKGCKCEQCKDAIKIGEVLRCGIAAPQESKDDQRKMAIVTPTDGCDKGISKASK